MGSDKRKQSLYFPDEHLEEIKSEAIRQDRSMSWVVQKAWELSRDTIKQFPSANDFLPDDSDDEREKD